MTQAYVSICWANTGAALYTRVKRKSSEQSWPDWGSSDRRGGLSLFPSTAPIIEQKSLVFQAIISFSHEKKGTLNEITRATSCWISLEEELQYVVSQPGFTDFCWRAGQNKILNLYLRHRGTKEKYSLTPKLRKVSWANSNHFHPS